MKDAKHTIKMELITPVHIGNDNFLQNIFDFIIENDNIYLIDTQKVFEKIGYDEKQIQTLVAGVERGESLKHIFPGRITNLEDVSKRIIPITCNISEKGATTLKECLHDGRGIAYIPGSSIKGAIRSAIMGTLAQEQRGGKPKDCEKAVFGKDPYCDFMRFMQVSDAYFFENCEIATKSTSLNIQETKQLLDNTLEQLTECVEPGNETTFTIKISANRNRTAVQEVKWNKSYWKDNMPMPMKSLPAQVSDIENLFKTINAHTLRLINEDIDFWNNFYNTDWEKYMRDFSLQDENNLKNYINALIGIRREIKNSIEGEECVLRIGYASGWKFMTGSWITDKKELKEAEISVREHKNKQTGKITSIYTHMPFPKTRRIEEFIDEDNNRGLGLLGFVKLKINK